MNWLDWAFIAVILCVMTFMVGSSAVLYKIYQRLEHSDRVISSSLQGIVNASGQLMQVHHQLRDDLQRMAAFFQNCDDTSDSTVERLQALSSQVMKLGDFIDHGFRQFATSPAQREIAPTDGSEPNSTEALLQRMRDRLKDALTDNMRLKSEVAGIRAKVYDAEQEGQALGASIHRSGAGEYVIQDLTRQCDELKADLQEARRRTRVAEKTAEENASKLEDLRDSVSIQQRNDRQGVHKELQAATQQVQDLLQRERILLARIESMEAEFSRHLTEKEFIEERYVQMEKDSGNDVKTERIN